MRDFLHDLLKRYLEHTISVEHDENDNVIRERIGVSQIFDTALLDEIAKFNPDGNFDRIVAFELALAMSSQLDPIGKVRSLEDDPRRIAYFNKEKPTSSIFQNTFTNKYKKIKSLFK
jgi:hypothetical protein